MRNNIVNKIKKLKSTHLKRNLILSGGTAILLVGVLIFQNAVCDPVAFTENSKSSITPSLKSASNNATDSVRKPLKLSVSSSNVTRGSVVTLTATGGIPPYEYIVDSGPGTISGNLYTAPTSGIGSGETAIIMVIDSEKNSVSAPIKTQGSVITVTLKSASTTPNGPVTVTFSGGVPPYTATITGGGTIDTGTLKGTVETHIYTAPSYPTTATLEVTDSEGETAESSLVVQYLSGGITSKIQTPYANDRIFGTVTVSGIAQMTDPRSTDAIANGLLYVDEEWQNLEFSGKTFKFDLDTTSYSNGQHTLKIEINSKKGRQYVSSIKVKIANNALTSGDAQGGSGGGSFGPEVMSGMNIAGFTLYKGDVINSIQAIFASAFGQPRTATGATHGGSGSTSSSLLCTALGGESYRVSGMKGTVGTLYKKFVIVDTLALRCADQTGVGEPFWTSTAGTTGKTTDVRNFETYCPSGTFAVGIKGRSGEQVDQLQLLCQ